MRTWKKWRRKSMRTPQTMRLMAIVVVVAAAVRLPLYPSFPLLLPPLPLPLKMTWKKRSTHLIFFSFELLLS
jgi:hypothetical protein